MEEIKTANAPSTVGHYSQGIIDDGFIFVSGQVDGKHPFVSGCGASAYLKKPVSLSEPFSGDGERALEDYLSDSHVPIPGEFADKRLLQDRVREVLKSLAPREREVLELRFGLVDGTARTLDEVARMYGITRERIRQIEARGLLKLRQPGRSCRLEDFNDGE